MSPLLAPQRLDAFTAMAWTWAVDFAPRLLTAALIAVLGVVIARRATNFAFGVAERTTSLDPTIEPVLRAAFRYAILILAAIAALGQLGVQTASLLAVLGAAGLAIGLALQGTLSNIAAGLMLLWLRPFRVGDFIEVVSGSPFAGTVKEMGLFACLLENNEGNTTFAPNSAIWSVALHNRGFARDGQISFHVDLSAQADLARARALVLEIVSNDGRVFKAPAPNVYVDRLDSGDFRMTCRLWTTSLDASMVRSSLVALVTRSLGSFLPQGPGGAAAIGA